MTGRPSTYTSEIAREICARLSEGKSLRSICRSDDIPHRDTVRVWLGKHEDFQEQYRFAHDLQADSIFEKMQEIADDASADYKLVERGGESIWVFDHEHVQRARLRVEARKWHLSKLAPKKYGAIHQHIERVIVAP